MHSCFAVVKACTTSLISHSHTRRVTLSKICADATLTTERPSIIENPTANPKTFAARSAGRYAAAFDWADASAVEATRAVVDAYNAQVAALTRLCAALGVSRTVGRHALIRLLHFASGKRMTQFEVAAEMQVTSSNVTFLVDGLEKEGLVERQPHPSDRRTVYVQLTPEGEDFANLIVPSMARFMARMLDGFDENEKRSVADLLERFRRNAEAFDATSLD